MRFTGKIIKVGNGFAISISKSAFRQNNWKIGQMVEIIILNKNKKAAAKRLFRQTF
ncbi:hypothetical protein HY989_00405 [Candidatus Micrarchaeota archaeon]|nr:hypothetical protein [Candidatus Micrarchaeota archaeon]